MRQMQVFTFFQMIVWCRGLAAILAMLAGMVSVMAQAQSLDVGNPANEVIVKSGHFMARDHLVVDLKHGIEWMRCSVGQIWNCLLYTSPSPRDGLLSRMPSSA